MSGPIKDFPAFVANKVERLREAYEESKRVKQVLDSAKQQYYANIAKSTLK
jgi:hypothetical protein